MKKDTIIDEFKPVVAGREDQSPHRQATIELANLHSAGGALEFSMQHSLLANRLREPEPVLVNLTMKQRKWLFKMATAQHKKLCSLLYNPPIRVMNKLVQKGLARQEPDLKANTDSMLCTTTEQSCLRLITELGQERCVSIY